jgi:DNA primase
LTDERDEIRARIDIVDLIGREIQLKKAGKSWKGLCPFHPDKNPSFTVTQETGRYRCWSCGEAGDAFTWVMKRQNLEFIEALQHLAKIAGVELQQRRGMPQSERQRYEAAMEDALTFFREQFSKSTAAKEYCERRSLDKAVLDRWEIGYAPDVGEALAMRLKKGGFTLSDCKALFLVDQDASGGYYDKFRGRLMIPIRDERGQLVAFGGRVLGDGTPKYINSSDTPLYRKSRVLFGMNVAREAISKGRMAVLVEGYLDVIACHRAEVNTAVASLGTALSEDQAKLLKRWCDEVVILYDSDDAGRKAADRAIEILQTEGVKVRVALMPQGDDPDTLLKKGGPAAVQDAVAQALSPIEYRLKALAQQIDYADLAYWDAAIEIIREASSMTEADMYIQMIAPQYRWERNLDKAMRTLQQRVRTARTQLNRAAAGRPVVIQEHHQIREKLSSAEIVLVHACLSDSLRSMAWIFAISPELFETSAGETMSQALRDCLGEEPPTGKPSEWLHRLEPEYLREVLSDILLDFRSENLSQERLIDSVRKLKEERDKRAVQEARRSGADPAKIFEMLKAQKKDPLAVKRNVDTLF